MLRMLEIASESPLPARNGVAEMWTVAWKLFASGLQYLSSPDHTLLGLRA